LKLQVALFTLFTAVCLFTVGIAVKAAEENKNALSIQTDISRFIGETLVYTIQWDPPWYMFFLPKMEAGELTFRLWGIEESRGEPAMKVSLEARSSGALASLAKMKGENEFLYYSNPETLCAEGNISKIREGRRMRLLELDYFQDERRLRFRATDESVTPPKLQRDIIKTDLPPCVKDPLTSLYFYRTLPLARGYVKNLTIGNDDRVFEVLTRIENQEVVNTPAGRFNAWKVSTNALQGGLFSQRGNFHIWVSEDELKAPVKFEVRVRLGHVLGTLKSVESTRDAGVGL
jgi:hypothetical protein